MDVQELGPIHNQVAYLSNYVITARWRDPIA